MGTLDCTNYKIELGPGDRLDNPRHQRMPGICDFSNTTITFEPTIEDDFEYQECHEFYGYVGSENNYYKNPDPNPMSYMCDGEVWLDHWGNFVDLDGWFGMGDGQQYVESYKYGLISDTVEVTVEGIVGIDDFVRPSGLTINSCQKCLNTQTFLTDDEGNVILASDQPISTEADSLSFLVDISDQQIMKDFDTCCHCNGGVSTCITNAKVYKTATQRTQGGVSYLDHNMYVDFIHNTSTVLARFEKFLGSTNYSNFGLSEPGLGYNCDGLFLEDFVYVSGDSVAVNSGDAVNIWQRCDFSDAQISLRFESHYYNGHECYRPEPFTCSFCGHDYRDSVRDYIVSIPEGWTYVGNDRILGMSDACNGTFDDTNPPSGDVLSQPIAGDFLLENPVTSVQGFVQKEGCKWQFIDVEGVATDCCPRAVDQQITLEIKWDANLNKFYVLLTMYWKIILDACPEPYLTWLYGSAGGTTAYGTTGIEHWVYYKSDYIDPEPANNIRLGISAGEDLHSRYGSRHMDCSVLDGMGLEYAGESTGPCNPDIPTNPFPGPFGGGWVCAGWEWDKTQTITIEEA
jgi:hypothetical protein